MKRSRVTGWVLAAAVTATTAAAITMTAGTALSQEVVGPGGTKAAEAKPQSAMPQIGMGAVAPKLAGKFIKGEPVTEYQPGVVYVMEFWATWCLPCKAAIPHLNELHNKYKDQGVVIIGQSVWEASPDAAPAFVEKMGDNMAYRIALDVTEGEPAGSKGVMARTWLGAAGIQGIPSTWIVKDGKVLWIGHPRDLTGEMLEKIKGGSFDIGGAKKDLADKAAQIEHQKATQQRFWDAVRDKDMAGVDAALVDLKAIFADRPGAEDSLMGMRLRALSYLGRKDDAMVIAKEIMAKATTPREVFNRKIRAAHEMLVVDPTDAAMLGEISAIVDSIEVPPDSDLQKAAYMVKKYKAWVSMLKGDPQTAVKLQEEVVSLMPDNMFKPVETRVLELYRQGKAPGLMPKHSRDRKPAAAATTKPAEK